MRESMFAIGLSIEVVSLIVVVVTCTALEIVGFDYWALTSVAMFVSTALTTIAGILCGLAVDV